MPLTEQATTDNGNDDANGELRHIETGYVLDVGTTVQVGLTYEALRLVV